MSEGSLVNEAEENVIMSGKEGEAGWHECVYDEDQQ